MNILQRSYLKLADTKKGKPACDIEDTAGPQQNNRQWLFNSCRVASSAMAFLILSFSLSLLFFINLGAECASFYFIFVILLGDSLLMLTLPLCRLVCRHLPPYRLPSSVS